MKDLIQYFERERSRHLDELMDDITDSFGTQSDEGLGE